MRMNSRVHQRVCRSLQICYGIIYGMGAKSLGEQMGVEENDAACYIETFKSRYRGVLLSESFTPFTCSLHTLTPALPSFRDQRFPQRNCEELRKERFRSDSDGPEEIPTWNNQHKRARQSTRKCITPQNSKELTTARTLRITRLFPTSGRAPGGEHNCTGVSGRHR